MKQSLISRLHRVRRLLDQAEATMRRDAEDDDGKARSLANDIGYIRDRVVERLRLEGEVELGGRS